MIVAVIALALSGVLGQRTDTVSVAGNGYRLDVTYPSVARPGLDIRWKIAVTNPNGFGDKLTIGLSQDTFDLFDFNGISPDPDSVTSTGDLLIYEWDRRPGTRFLISIDAYIEYGEHFGRTATAAVLVDDRPVLTARYKIRMVP